MNENFPYILTGFYYTSRLFQEDGVRRVREADEIAFENKRKAQQKQQ